jgi:hypothetical protein
LLGRSRRQIATYAAIGPIPRVVALACYGFESLRRDRFLSGSGHINAQPPKAHAAPAPDRSEQPHSPAAPASPRQRILS